jgi:hypothetical protein
LRINFLLYSDNHSVIDRRDDIIHQLNFLEDELKYKNLGERMQQIFPEGYVFVNALYGLAWCELGMSPVVTPEIKKHAMNEALYAFESINGSNGQWNFSNDLTPQYGVFYAGWRNYLLSKILMVDTNFNASEFYIASYKAHCEELELTLQNAQTPYFESYPNQTWPADMLVAIASLSNHDKIFAPKYKRTIEKWLQLVKQKIDPKTGLIPHKVDSKTGDGIEKSRGCSMVLSMRMLFDIDNNFAKQQYELMQKSFITTSFGLPSVREFDKNQFGLGDIDSGPVIFGVGFAATIVMIGTFAVAGEYELAEQQYQTINAFGTERNSKTQKSYLLGKLPIADAFIAWGRATNYNQSNGLYAASDKFWRLKFQFISFLIVAFLGLLMFRRRLLAKIKNLN